MSEILYVDAGEYEEREAVFSSEDAGKRLDAAIAGYFPDLSRSRVQAIIESGGVRPPGLTKNTRVKAGDRVVIIVNERIPLKAGPEDIEIHVVFEDDDVIVVDKERGMVVHPAKGNTTGTLVNALLWHYEQEHKRDGSEHKRDGSFYVHEHKKNRPFCVQGPDGGVRPGVVHRIDKNTSGLLVVTKNDAAHAALAEQFAAHTIRRRYMAIVLGGFREEEGTVDAPLGRDPKNRLKQAVLGERGKRAVTNWRVIERISGREGVYTLLELSLETGRTHQIRAHMAYIGRHVLGDDLYGPARGPAAGTGQYLHAAELGFVHPATGEPMLFESPLPAYFTDMLEKLRRA